MSITSHYYRVTPQILIEHRTNQYDIINNVNDFTQPSKYYIYKGLNGGIYYTEEPRYTDQTSQDYFKNQSLYQKYPDASKSRYTYLGIDYPITDVMKAENTDLIESVTAIAANNSGVEDYDVRLTTNFFYDTLNIYLLRGFSFDDLEGIGIQVKAPATYDINKRVFFGTISELELAVEFTIKNGVTYTIQNNESYQITIYYYTDGNRVEWFSTNGYSSINAGASATFLAEYDCDKVMVVHKELKQNWSISNNSERTYSNEVDVTLLDFYLSKEAYETNRGMMEHYLSSPLYMNSKFYDRYITVEYPSAYAIGVRDYNFRDEDYDDVDNNDFSIVSLEYDDDGDAVPVIYKLNPSANAIIEFETCSDGNVTSSISTEANEINFGSSGDNSVMVNNTVVDADQILFDDTDSAVVLTSSTSDFFNVRIYEDSDTESIIYYPTYGDSESCQELDGAVMAQIEAGAIPVSANAFYDLSSSSSSTDSESTVNAIDYGSDSLYYADSANGNDGRTTVWEIRNDLDVTYINSENDYKYYENYSRTIDYENNSTSTIAYWRSKFVPDKTIIESISADTIAISYTCTLLNTYSNTGVMRIASLNVDASKYTDTIASYLNVNTYKIVNKIQQTTPTVINQQEQVKEKYVRSYYNATNLVAKNIGTGGNIYTQGQMTLSLYRSNNNYLIQLFNINSDNVRIPYDLTGPYKYKIVFPISDSNTLSISPNSDSTHQNLGIGTLVFYITGEQASQIMSVSEDKRYFSIMTDLSGSSAQETVLYEGKVAWLS